MKLSIFYVLYELLIFSTIIYPTESFGFHSVHDGISRRVSQSSQSRFIQNLHAESGSGNMSQSDVRIRNGPEKHDMEAQRILSDAVNKLKNVLKREYLSFFDPMQTEYYSDTVTFQDPMTSLSGVRSYQNNVDMLSARTFMGKILFRDANILLHNIQGGKVLLNDSLEEQTNPICHNILIEDIITRWTLRLTIQILPWKPIARFSGISVYKVVRDNSQGTQVQISKQTDYWDSINIAPYTGGKYRTVKPQLAIADFLSQLRPEGFQAKEAATELPYILLRRGDGYEVRSYPSFTAAKVSYSRRDEAFNYLGSFMLGLPSSAFSPALMQVRDTNEYSNEGLYDKSMMWPLTFGRPGEDQAITPADILDKAKDKQWNLISIVSIPPAVVAVQEFADASMEPIVRRVDQELRKSLERDGLKASLLNSQFLKFAQYDAIFSMGRRRGEVWIDLEDGCHPWQQ